MFDLMNFSRRSQTPTIKFRWVKAFKSYSRNRIDRHRQMRSNALPQLHLGVIIVSVFTDLKSFINNRVTTKSSDLISAFSRV